MLLFLSCKPLEICLALEPQTLCISIVSLHMIFSTYFSHVFWLLYSLVCLIPYACTHDISDSFSALQVGISSSNILHASAIRLETAAILTNQTH